MSPERHKQRRGNWKYGGAEDCAFLYKSVECEFIIWVSTWKRWGGSSTGEYGIKFFLMEEW